MKDETRDAAVKWLMSAVLGGVPFGENEMLAVMMTDDVRHEGNRLLAKIKHEQDRPTDRGA